jgi:hypothetical protein
MNTCLEIRIISLPISIFIVPEQSPEHTYQYIESKTFRWFIINSWRLPERGLLELNFTEKDK